MTNHTTSQQKFHSIRSYVFLIALFVLLLNDFFLKYFFPGWITGKLSDFSGLIVFSLFWATLFPSLSKTVFVLTGIGFILWKSSLSQPFIDIWNQYSWLSLSRVVDYTDLLALFVLPFAYYFHLSAGKRVLSLHPVPLMLVAAFAFGATSYYNEHKVSAQYDFSYSLDTLHQRIYDLPIVFNNYRDSYLPDSSGQYFINIYTHDTLSDDPINYFIRDTLTLFVRDTSFFQSGYEAKIVMIGNDSLATIFLQGFSDRFHKSTFKSADYLSSFEREIIDKLKRK